MLKKLGLLLLPLLALTSCQDSNVGKDGYKFYEKQYEKSTVTVNIVTYKTRKEFMEAAKKRGVTDEGLVAFSILKPPFDTCTINMMDPTVEYKPEFIGHEFAHCVYGQFHKDNETH